MSRVDLRLHRRWIVALEVAIICVWGSSILLLADALSGPFAIGHWASMVAIWLGIPLAITGAFVGCGNILIGRGKETAGLVMAAVPLILLAAAAAWAWFFG